uniref:Uncharacterized protein n=1 Tax=Ditylenchus dipsaci TaxID=166011 RepID=A0A915D344_9BILA
MITNARKYSICSGISEREYFAAKLLHNFGKHNGLADKISEVDGIFKIYAFTMMIMGSTTTIFAMLSLIRTEKSFYLLFSAHDLACCLYHLFGLCVIPAQVYTQFRAIQHIIYRQQLVWMEYDLKIYQIIGMISDNVTQSQVGITLWGITPITKPLILTCLSLVIPYVLLCLQFQIGAHLKMQIELNKNGTIL